MTQDELLTAAVALAEAGLRPVPVRTDKKRPAQKGWSARATSEPGEQRRVFASAWNADAIGVATGEGLFVLDLDRNHDNGADGVETFAALVREHGGVPRGPRANTPRGGVHLYFALPAERHARSRVAVLPGVDVRGDGGMAMAPPSQRGDGAYTWARDPWSWPTPMAPDWVLDLVAPPPASPRPVAPLRAYDGVERPYARAVLDREVRKVAEAPRGQRNATLFRAAASLGSLAAAGNLSPENVATALREAAGACGLIAEDGEGAVDATIASGLMRGLAAPRAIPTGGRHGR